MALETTPAQNDPRWRRPNWRQIAATAAALVLLLTGWALVAPQMGLAWPYPQRLPDTVNYHGLDYRREDCLTRDYVLHRWGGEGGRLAAFASLPSAVVFGGPQMLEIEVGSGDAPGAPTVFYVATGHGCLALYGIVQGEPH
jgi:hypothetical protein